MYETYTLHVAGLTRELKKVRVAPSLRIASFVMLGDTRLIERCADALYEKIKDGGAEILVCPEAKGIPLTHALAVRLGVDYVVARKSVKGYMERPIVAEVKSITTTEKQIIVVDEFDAEKLKGKKVCIVDDVVSTGGSLASLEAVLKKTGCTVIGKVAVLLEEGGYSGEDLTYLERLPVFKD
ncbi:phosphoribosyltransferase family protein [Synergistes jonesii]|uniref:Adenine phosphoribosyltransferase n=1 Tax=Synergistes jonesii TaxID=2754 RepID=A0A073ISZ9_9BACT|nr:phosphoribosyltransferase family protein [Synergistes jonesii]KEJ92929.1 adenine phosphoribosyltransferase [Synergistes jonesii]OFB62184.1 adenine phosphoribosyltransferase [Synergistes jonesii]OFB64312.1 adenine phosphoribosyltransferase [Synergistes jonesii]OFB65604.1 adenine phosphoribosyltransferase [Synergistes jonesii]OFB68565.1 adenine phosphoribosyltransferase [Synergistes jonesii]